MNTLSPPLKGGAPRRASFTPARLGIYAFLLTAALFRTDVYNEVYENDDGTYSQIGKKRVQGIELSATGKITRNWDVTAAYTHQKTDIVVGDATAQDGSSTLLYAPEDALSLWSTYRLPLGLTVFALWFTWWCDAEVKRQFGQIVTAEIGMGFYDIDVEGEPVLPAMYKNSPVVTRPIVWAGYVAQTVSLLVIGIVAVLLG